MLAVGGLAPLSELDGYAARLKSMTGGQGAWTMALSHYEQAPPNLPSAARHRIRQAPAARGRITAPRPPPLLLLPPPRGPRRRARSPPPSRWRGPGARLRRAGRDRLSRSLRRIGGGGARRRSFPPSRTTRPTRSHIYRRDPRSSRWVPGPARRLPRHRRRRGIGHRGRGCHRIARLLTIVARAQRARQGAAQPAAALRDHDRGRHAAVPRARRHAVHGSAARARRGAGATRLSSRRRRPPRAEGGRRLQHRGARGHAGRRVDDRVAQSRAGWPRAADPARESRARGRRRARRVRNARRARPRRARGPQPRARRGGLRDRCGTRGRSRPLCALPLVGQGGGQGDADRRRGPWRPAAGSAVRAAAHGRAATVERRRRRPRSGGPPNARSPSPAQQTFRSITVAP